MAFHAAAFAALIASSGLIESRLSDTGITISATLDAGPGPVTPAVAAEFAQPATTDYSEMSGPAPVSPSAAPVPVSAEFARVSLADVSEMSAPAPLEAQSDPQPDQAVTVAPRSVPTAEVAVTVAPSEPTVPKQAEPAASAATKTETPAADPVAAVNPEPTALAAAGDAGTTAASTDSGAQQPTTRPAANTPALASTATGGGERRGARPAPGNPRPRYPRVAVIKGIEGSLVLAVHVDERGTVGDLRVHSGSGHRMLDRAAVRTIRKWRFEPALENGIALADVAMVPVEFRLVDAR